MEISNQDSECHTVIRTRHILDTSQRYNLSQLPWLERGTVVVSALKTEAADFSVDMCLPNCTTSHPRVLQPYKTMDFVYNNTPYVFIERGFQTLSLKVSTL
jgi:hypothetical protein